MMKVFKMILMLVVVLTMAVTAEAQKKGEKTVIFNANLHCESCKAKIEKNIPFEKGVKDLKVDLKANTITVTFREDKTSKEQLRKAIEKLNIEVKGCAENPAGDKKKNGEKSSCPENKKECCRDKK